MNSSRLIRLNKVNTILKIFTFLCFFAMAVICIILTIPSLIFCLWILVMNILFATLIRLKDLYDKELKTIKIRCNKYHERINFINNLHKANVAINTVNNN